ncbi:unnamed protein product [Ambrosiozyma monospora]|uniref:Unnamed protein product n=1 Tax=Ambrosiozyma monospora TaxID=43982 RepID=A0ACB5TD72_AMBMO|nr:unnamed protein product [Ambrosiozyma monospora]
MQHHPIGMPLHPQLQPPQLRMGQPQQLPPIQGTSSATPPQQQQQQQGPGPNGRMKVVSGQPEIHTFDSEASNENNRKKAKRSSKACIICHQRKIKCDLDSRYEGEKCSNCDELGLKCELYKRKKRIRKYQIHENLKQLIDKTNIEKLSTIRLDPVIVIQSISRYIQKSEPFNINIGGLPGENELFNGIVKEKFNDLEQVATEAFSTFSHDGIINENELEFLTKEGCFTLPSRDLCDLYINEYFKRVHPAAPILNKEKFLKDYNDLNNPPSLLLLQAVITAGSRDINEPCVNEHQRQAQNKVTLLLYRRAALLMSNFYEVDPMSSLQALILLSFVRPSDNPTLANHPQTRKTPLYWTDIAALKCNTIDLVNTIPPNCGNSEVDVCTSKKVFWYLVAQDAFLQLTCGKPPVFNLDTLKLPKLTMHDFRFDTDLSENTKAYMIESISFAELANYIGKKQEEASVLAYNGAKFDHVIRECDILMSKWFENVPAELKFKLHDKKFQNIYSAYLSVNFYVLLSNVHTRQEVTPTGPSSPILNSCTCSTPPKRCCIS